MVLNLWFTKKKLRYFVEIYCTLIYYRKVMVAYQNSKILTIYEKYYGYITETKEFKKKILLSNLHLPWI